MRLRIAGHVLVLAAIAGLTAAPRAIASAAGVAFVDLPRLVISHPLHSVLLQYDSEIAALRGTQNVAGLREPAAVAAQGATALQADALVSAARANATAARDPASRAREQAAIAQVVRSQRAAASGLSTYTTQLVSETNANLRAYGNALSQRTQRAYAAREQELREQELTLAYDLARRNAAKRSSLQLKLDNLHLDATRRTSLLAELAALNAGEQRAMDAMRHSNAEQLATYRAQLERDATAAAGEQDRQLRTKSGANYLILQRVFNEARNGFGELPSPAQTAAFSRSYAASGSARTIASAMQSSADDLSQRYRQLATRDAQSQREVDAQLRTLESDREALYRSIVAQVRAAALTYARQRGLGSVVFANAPPKAGQLDLTASIAARLGQGI